MSPQRNDGPLVQLVDQFLDVVAAVGVHDLLVGGVVLILGAGDDDVVVRLGLLVDRLDVDGVRLGVESRVEGHEHVDDAGSDVGQRTGGLRGFQLGDLQVLRVGHDVVRRGVRTFLVVELDQAGGLEQQQAAGRVDGVVGDGDFGAFRNGLRPSWPCRSTG